MLDVLRWLWTTQPEPVVEARARDLLLDTIGCAIAGTAEPQVQALFRHAATEPGAVRFPGVSGSFTSTGFTAPFAAAACWHEACEGLALAHGRPGLHAIPAVLGQALANHLPLGTLLDAIVAGYEIGGRMGMLCRIRPGMHVDGTWGSFGAAAAWCRLNQTSPDLALAALNHVACHMPFSLYRPITAGSTARNAYPGHGAAHGMAAAAASLAGLGGPPGSIAAMAHLALGLDLDAATMPGPAHWLLLDGYLKPYPAVRHVHYAAAAADAWHAANIAPASDIAAVTLHTYNEALTYCGNRAPDTAIQAQFSLSYGTARSLTHGRLDPAAYTSDSLANPLTRHIEALVDLREDTTLTETARRGCTLEVRTSANTWRCAVGTVPGDPGTPMTRTEILGKFRDYAAPVIGAARAEAIATQILDAARGTPLDLNG